MADVSHELGSLRFVVDSPLSSKVAMFNNHAQQHKQTQLLNPFSSQNDGRSSPKPTFSKDEYGKPLAGSLTEARGQKANMHVMREMVELCQIIDSEGYAVNDEPDMRVIPFGELFNIYNFISDKVVGILLRARKYKYVDFEGEILFQRRDDDVPIFLLKPIKEIRNELETKIAEIKRASSPAPQSTSVLLDQSAHQQKLEEAGLVTAAGEKSKTPSRTPSPSKAKTVAAASKPETEAAVSIAIETAATAESSAVTPADLKNEETVAAAAVPVPVSDEANKLLNSSSSTDNAAADNKVELPTIVIEATAVYVKGNNAAATVLESTAATTETSETEIFVGKPIAEESQSTSTAN